MQILRKLQELKVTIMPNDWFVAGWLVVGVIILVDLLEALR